MILNRIYLLLIVIFVFLLCKNNIIYEGYTIYKWTNFGENSLEYLPISNTSCNNLLGLSGFVDGNDNQICGVISDECIDLTQDPPVVSEEGDTCNTVYGSGVCLKGTDNKLRCHISTQNINNRIDTEIDSQTEVSIIPSKTYYSIMKNDETKIHAPACSEDTTDICNNLMTAGGNCRRDDETNDCCLCNQSMWNKVYTSNHNDTHSDNSTKAFSDNINIFNGVPSEDKSDYSIIKLESENLSNGLLTDIRDTDNFKRYIDIPSSDSTSSGSTSSVSKKYTPSKGFFFNQYRQDYDTLHEFNIHEYPNYIQSSDDGTTQIGDPFYYEECLYNKIDGNCVCDNTMIPSHLQTNKLSNPICVSCPPGSNSDGTSCSSCNDLNKVVYNGNCVTCDHESQCPGRNQCIFRKDENGLGKCIEINDDNRQVIRSDCKPKIGTTANCNHTSYYLSNNTESSLDNYYDSCLRLSTNCEVVQNLIHESEGYINYNSTEPIAYDPTNYNSTGMSNPEYNLITNEYCKKINNQNDCDQIKQCIWNENIYTGESKCLLNLNTSAVSPFNEIRVSDKTYYYIPLPNSIDNALEYDCSKYDSSNCQNQQCQLSQGGVCLKKDSSDIRCSVNRSEPTYSYYDHKLDLPSSISESLLNSHLECSKLQENGINDVEYIGDPKGICINDSALNPTLIHTGCVDSKDLNDLILHKSEDYINSIVAKAYLTDLVNMRESSAATPPAVATPPAAATPPADSSSTTGSDGSMNIGCIADITGDGIVNVEDVLKLLAAYGITALGDINDDGVTRVNDLLLMMSSFGTSGCPPDPCLSKPCQNGGECSIDSDRNFICSCPSGFSGDDCSIIEACLSNPCQNGGTCSIDSDRNLICSCLPGFSGDDCSNIDSPIILPEIHNIGVTTNHNLIAGLLLSESCISDPSICIDESKSSKLIDNCRELCENNPNICNEYGVKFPTSIDDYSNSGCYLSKYCTSSAEVNAGGCIPQSCNTSLTDPYEGCILPNYTAFPDNYMCNIVVPPGGSIGGASTDEGDDITDNTCRNLCSQSDNCAGYQFNDVTETRTTQQCTIFTGRPEFDDVVTPSEGSYCYRKEI